MDIPLVIRHRLKELGLEQKDLAEAAQVTESYISQLLARKKAAPAPGRTDLYEKMGQFLRLPVGELSKLADVQRREGLKQKIAEAPRPLFKDCREMLLRKCAPDRRNEVWRTFEKDAFGELERLVTQTILEVTKRIARQESESEEWLYLIEQISERNHEQRRDAIREFLDTDVFRSSVDNSVIFLDPLIESWDIDLKTFGMEIILNRRLTFGGPRRVEFVEREPEVALGGGPGLDEFLQDPLLSGDATEEEIAFLRSLRFKKRQPTAIYYYRELQNLRDPLHFRALQQP